MSKFIYTCGNALGTISIFCMVTEGFDWKFVIGLVISALITVNSPYSIRRRDEK
ncbi:hypothetical protein AARONPHADGERS_52 [Bacillus phage AaronPhadgers]|uniref:hypothetical protein n=1 Tax=Bacillus phage Zuko TaxID=1805956 RepID=UPI0007A772C5|nr:hypothetical protein BI001_gp049 [Bacillus phage Zuko]AMW62445.1 hypothetical protein ZUKO_49 [Bacillus phage Zuko]AOZ62298.1 hypothetical protein SBP8a_48 [Bacillus phage SBP8a]ASR79071.1 hypothetical protein AARONPHADGERS_52 [Bacillus phage AaronPhadgers]